MTTSYHNLKTFPKTASQQGASSICYVALVSGITLRLTPSESRTNFFMVNQISEGVLL